MISKIILLIFILFLVLFCVKYLNNIEFNILKKPIIKEFIYIQNKKFSENYIILQKGDTIEIENLDNIRHTVVCDSSQIQNSDLLYKGDKHQISFWFKGTYILRSSLYPEISDIHVLVK